MKKLFFLVVASSFFFFPVNGQVPPPLGPPEIPANASSSELGISLFISKVKENLQSAVARVNHAIDSMASSSGVNAQLSHTVVVKAPYMAFSMNSQVQNSRFARVVFKVTYTISNIRYHNLPYFERKVFQDVTLVFACQNWFTGNGSAIVKVAADKPLLDEASFGEQALNFFIGNTLTNLLDRKLKEVISGVGGSAVVSFPAIKCNCISLSPGNPPNFDNGSMRYAFIPPKRISPAGNTITVSLKSIKRLKIIDLPDPVEESVNLEFHANHKSIVAPVNRIKAGEEQLFNNVSINTNRPGSTDLLVLIGNISVIASGETFSNSVVWKKDQNFGFGTRKFIVVRSFMKVPLPGPDGKPPKPYMVYRPQFEITLQISGDGGGMEAGGMNR